MDGLIKQAASSARLPIFDRMSVLADPIRCRLLLVLERHELTVSELCSVLQLPQSTVSRHLKVLAEGGWVFARREGTSRRYAMGRDHLETEAQRLWSLVREQVGAETAIQQDHHRLESVVAQRRSRSQEFFSTAAGRWAQMRREMFGKNFDLHALLGLLDPSWTIADLGAGTGQISEYLAPFVEKVITIDDSDAMLRSATQRLAGFANVEIRRGQLEALPLADGELDAATLFLVLHHLSEPQRALQEISRALRPGGRFLLVDMLPHGHEEYRLKMGHVWLGFAENQLRPWLEQAGFENVRYSSLTPDPNGKGPALFAASAGRSREALTTKTSSPRWS